MNDKVTFGHTARKRFGQNFLQDQHVIQNIVRSINPQFDDNIVEIGPGLAALTEPVSEKVNKLHVIELDKDLAKRLREHPFLSPKLDIHEDDALKFDFSAIQKFYYKFTTFLSSDMILLQRKTVPKEANSASFGTAFCFFNGIYLKYVTIGQHRTNQHGCSAGIFPGQ